MPFLSEHPISRFEVPELDDLPEDIRDTILATNHCLYCVVAHGAILRIRSKNPLLADQVAVNATKADLSERERHIADFALEVAHDSANVTDGDLDEMRAKGFTDEEIWDIGAITALFALSNRYANFAGIRPNDEFFNMAR